MYYENWFEGRDAHPVRLAIYDQEKNLKEDISVKNETAVIIKKDGNAIPAKMKKRFGLIGKNHIPLYFPEECTNF